MDANILSSLNAATHLISQDTYKKGAHRSVKPFDQH